MNGVAEGAFRRHYGHVYGYFRRRLGDPERAEELTQDVFVAPRLRSPAQGRRPARPRLALHTVARRRFADEARRRGRERRASGILPGRSSSSEYEPIASALREAIGTLPTGQARVVLLKLVRGLTFAEIGAEVGLTEAAAKMRFVRGLERLRAELSERGIER